MSVQGVGGRPEISTSEAEAAEKAAPSATPASGSTLTPTSAPVGRTPAPPAGLSPRMDVQRRLLERTLSTASGGVDAISGGAPAARAAGVGPNARLRSAFDGLNVPVGPARTHRLDSNVEAFASRWKTLEGAKKSFDTTYFFWDDDIFGYAFLGEMMKKAKEGVAIRGMMDDTGNRGGKGLIGLGSAQDYLQELVNVDPKRVQIGIFNPMLRKVPTSLEALVSSNHDKLAIADGSVVETGGRNIGSDYFSDPKDRKGVFRDTDLRIESPTAARSATRAFDLEFADDDTVKIKPDRGGNWNKRDVELLGAAAMMDWWLKAPALSEAEKAAIRAGGPAAQKAADEALRQALAELPKMGVKRDPGPLEMKKLKELARDLASNPELRGSYDAKPPAAFDGEVKMLDRVAATTEKGANEISDGLISLIEGAQDSIVIHNPYVVMTERAIEAMAAAGKRGVKISILTNSPESTDSTATQAFFLEDWPAILARIPSSRIMVATGEQKHHAKTFVVDGVLTGVSTYNADWISAQVNSEIVALQWSEKFAADTLGSYRAALADPAHGMVEYRIKRDEQGRALVKDGKPIVEYGPEDHCPKEMLEAYKKRSAVANFAREHLDALAPLRRPKLDPARDPIHVIP